MAFFGEDGLQRQLKQAQRDLMAKDGQIASMHLVTKEKDEVIKKLRSEMERVREEKEDIMSNMASGSGRTDERSSEEKARLKAELNEAQDALNRSNMDLMRLREEARQNSIQLHNSRIAKSSTSFPLSTAAGSSRRRSTSLSSDTRVKDLEAELQAMRESAGSPAVEIDGLKTQLANVKRDLNKAINEKMALEARAKKEVDAVKSQLDDANFELDALRRDMDDGGNSVSQKEVDRQRKAWDGEKQELQIKITKLETAARDNQEEMGRLRAASDEVASLNDLLEQERSKPSPTPTATAPVSSVDNAEIARLTSEVASLQADLTAARAQTAAIPAPAASSDLTVRRLQRQLEKAQRDIEALEQSLDQSEEENQALRSRVPLPGSPGSWTNDSQVMSLEADNDELRAEVDRLRDIISAAQIELDALRGVKDELATVQSELDGRAGELEGAKAALRVSEEEKQASGPYTITLLEQVATTRATLADAQHNASEHEHQLQALQGQLKEINTQLAGHVERVTSLSTELDESKQIATDTGAREQETLQRLAEADRTIHELQSRPTAADVAAELSEANQQVDKLRIQASELETVIAIVTKEKDDMINVCSRLTLDKDQLNERLASQQDELEEAKSTNAVAHVHLDQAHDKVARLERDLATLQEELDAAITERVKIQQKLVEAQDALANRSTESEADRRDTELMQLRSELDNAKAAASEKESELQREVRLLTFTKEQDVKAAMAKLASIRAELHTARQGKEESETTLRQTIASLEKDAELAQQRIDNLMQEVSTLQVKVAATPSPRKAPATSTPDRVGLLYAKIQSLRAERDDLRQSLSFAQNESRFTISAAQADRQSALDELERVKRDFNTQLTVHEALENDANAVRAQLAEKEVKLEETKALYAGVTVDRGDVDDKIAQYERDAAAAETRQAELVKQIEASQNIIVELNHAMALMRSNTETDKRHRRISMDRKAEMSIISETSFGIAPTHERALSSSGTARRPGHTRTRSEMAALVLPDQAQISSLTGKVAELEAEVKTLSGKLERRNAALAIASRENEKLKMAQELNRESAEDFEELVAERDTLQATVEQRAVQVETLQAEITSGKSALTEQISKLQEIEAQVVASRAESAAQCETITTQHAKIETLSGELATMGTERDAADHRAGDLSQQVDNLKLDAVASNDQMATLLLNILAQRKRLAHAARAWRNASAGLRQQTTALATCTDKVAELTTQVGAFEAERDVMAQQLESYTQRGRALDAANEQVHDLESQLETLQAECVAMAEELDKKVADDNDESKAQLEVARLRIDAVSTELADANTRVATLSSELDAVRSDLSVSESSKADLDGRLDEAQRTAASAAEEHKAKLAEAGDKAERAEAEAKAISTQLEEAVLERDTLQQTVQDVQAQLDQASASSTDRTLTLQSANADLQRQLDEATHKVEHLRIEVSSLMTKNQLLSSDMAEVKSALENSQKQLSIEQEARQQRDHEVMRLTKAVETHDAASAGRNSEIKHITEKVASLEAELTTARADAASAKAALDREVKDLEAVRTQNVDLQGRLTAASDAQVDNAAVDDLKERIEELEKSLLAKTEEVDEADDRTREAYKAKVKLEKKVAKLTRQLGDKELEANTKRNKVIALEPPAAAAEPPTVPTALGYQRTPSGRAPLRPVTQVDSATHGQLPAIAATPATLKRTRDVEVDEKPLPAEAIMLPPSAPLSTTKKTVTRTSFTPKRNLTAVQPGSTGGSATKIVANNNAHAGANIFAPRS